MLSDFCDFVVNPGITADIINLIYLSQVPEVKPGRANGRPKSYKGEKNLKVEYDGRILDCELERWVSLSIV